MIYCVPIHRGISAINLPDQHSYIELSAGRCHFRIAGPENGQPVLMLHGATVPGWEFDRLVPYLHEVGFRTVCPDLFGHGYSARPSAPLDYRFFVQQVLELIDGLNLSAPMHLLGHSLGGAVATRVTLERPDTVASVVLLAPLLDFLAVNKSAKVLTIPLLGEVLMPTYVMPALVRRRTARYKTIDNGRFVDKFKDQLRIPGFGGALLSMIRSGALGDQSRIYESLAITGKDVLVLRGTLDSIFLASQFEAMKHLMPKARFIQFPGLEHPFMLTHPEQVAPAVTAFLK